MKKDRRNEDDFELFYMELPTTDYGDIEIQDEYDTTDSDKQGLSAEQVSEIARDSLEAAAKERPKLDPPKDNQD